MNRYRKVLLLALLLLPCLIAAGLLGGERKTYRYRDFQSSSACRDCHLEIHREWERSAMAKAYTLPWDQEEYFKLALPHSKIDPKVAGVKEGCIRCHSPVAYWAGDIPPERAEKNTPANQGVSCDLCHVITGLKGEEPHDGFFEVTPGRTKQGVRPFAKSEYHSLQLSSILRKAEFCAACHDETSPYGAWVKETYREWKAGPSGRAGMSCQECHMPRAPGESAKDAPFREDVAHHLFMGGNAPSMINGAADVRIYPESLKVLPGKKIEFSVAVTSTKPGHLFPSGSAEERQLWLRVEAEDEKGTRYHIPASRARGDDGKPFYSLTSNALAYRDLGPMLGREDFAGVERDALPEGDRIYRKVYLDPNGEQTIAQWNTVKTTFDNRLKPKESRIETYRWRVPEDLAPGDFTIRATLSYRRLPQSVADLVGIGEIPILPVSADRVSWTVGKRSRAEGTLGRK